MTQNFIAEMIISHPDLPLIPTIRTVDDVDVAVESQPLASSERSGPIMFYSLSGCGFQPFESALATDHTVDEWQVTMEFPDCRLYQVYHSSAAKFTSYEIAKLGLQVLSTRNTGRGWLMRLYAPEKERLGDYWRYCREEDVEFHLEKLYSTGPQAYPVSDDGSELSLTDRQREVARTAARMGYYEPDGAGAEAVADELGITSSTLSTHLRRILAEVFRQLFDD